MTIINNLTIPYEIEPYVDVFDLMAEYLRLKAKRLDLWQSEPNFQIMDEYYAHSVNTIWDKLPVWAKRLLNQEIE